MLVRARSNINTGLRRRERSTGSERAFAWRRELRHRCCIVAHGLDPTEPEPRVGQCQVPRITTLSGAAG